LDLQTLQTLIDGYHYKNGRRGEKIISVRKRNPKADKTAFEREIDRLYVVRPDGRENCHCGGHGQMKATLEVINRMRTDGVIGKYAIGGAVGATFYLEPSATRDIDEALTKVGNSYENDQDD
jgi:hypothetical protein